MQQFNNENHAKKLFIHKFVHFTHEHHALKTCLTHNFLLTPKINLNDDWNCFIDQFKALPINIQYIILRKLHGTSTM